MTNQHLINNFLNGIMPCLRLTIAYFEEVWLDPSEWKEKPLHIDFIATEFHKKEQDNRSNDKKKNSTSEERVQLRGEGELGSEKKKDDFVPKQV